MDERKDTGVNRRRKITLHSFRRHAKTVIATQTNSDYSEFYLGHAHSSYWTMKEPERRELYKKKCMPFLTFLDYGALENSSKGIISQLEQKDREIAHLTNRIRESDAINADTIGALSDKVMKLTEEFQALKNSISKK